MNTKYLFSSLTAIGIVSFSPIACAQTNPLSTRIPVADSSQIGTQVLQTTSSNFTITGGVNLGQNLLHSFTDFSVPTGGAATFDNSLGKQSIITRVTGKNFSDIDGLVNTQGANFFLINPNGIVFGTNAQLNVGQTFVGSTANGIDLVDGGGNTFNFLTNQSKDAQLLTINPNALFNVSRLNMGATLTNSQGIVNYGIIAPSNDNQYVGLIGGNVNINGGQIDAPGGRVELGGLSAPGTVTLGVEGNNLRAQFPTNVTRGDVSLINGSRVSVIGTGSGDVAINARNVEVLGRSTVIGGINAGSGTPATVAGDINLNATEKIMLSDFSAIANIVGTDAMGKGGRVEITTRNLSMTNASQLSTSTFGRGDAGNVKITSTGDISFDGGQDSFRSGIRSTVEPNAKGKGGGIEISTDNLSVTNRALLSASTLGEGDAGTIKITAKKDVFFDGGIAFNRVESGAKGTAGGIEIDTGNLFVTNGGQLSSSIFGEGNAGNIKITAKNNVFFDGEKNGLRSAAFSTVEPNAKGKGGGIKIDARNLSVTNNALLITSTGGQGDAGNIKITARDNVSFNNSDALNTVAGTGKGKGGDIEIDTGNLNITNGAQLQAGTFGQGDGGNIKVTAQKDVSFDGGIGASRSTAGSSVGENAKGKGGNVEIDAGNVSVTNGALLQAFTRGQGDAGTVKITAKSNVSIDGEKDGFRSDVLSTVEPNAKGKGGGIEIDTGNLSVTNGARLSASTFGAGDAGTIKITAQKDVTFDSALAFNRVESGAKGTAGGIEIDTGNLFVTNGGQLSSSIFGEGNAGNIKITAKNNVFFDGEKNGLRSAAFSTVEPNAKGKGGGIKIDARNLSVTNNALLTTSTRGQGDAGNIFLKSDRVILNQGGISSVSSAFTGGDIIVVAKDYLLFRNNSFINTNSFSTGVDGNGGNITINAPTGFIVTAPNENSDISANAFSGSGGKVNINTQQNFWISPLSRTELQQRLGTTDPNQLNPFNLPTNDITAISQVNPNLNGQVTTTPPEIDPSRGLSPLPNNVTDPSNQIDPNCSAKAIGNNSFTNVGRGGIPATPKDPLNEQEIATNWVRINPQDTRPLPPLATTTAPTTQAYGSEAKPIVEAQAWRRERNGDIVLVAAASGNLPRPPQPQAGCVDR